MDDFTHLTFAQMTARVASADPVPGAGPSLAWTCALAAALVEMVSAVSLRKEPSDPDAVAGRRDRATALRAEAIGIAQVDAEAYRRVLAAQRQRDQPGHSERLREALLAASDPLVEIIHIATEVTRLAAEAAEQAHGAVRGEAVAAAALAASVAQSGVKLVELNLAGAPDDPRRATAARAAGEAQLKRERAFETLPSKK